MTRGFDEINNRSVPYEQYFGEMELTDEQIEKRIEAAHDFEDMMLLLFALLSTAKKYNISDVGFINAEVEKLYLSVVGNYMPIDDYMENYAKDFSEEIVQSTVNNEQDPYYTSEDRAMFVAENESNTSLNYAEYINAVQSGRTKKKWITMNDKKVRHTHRNIDGKTLNIADAFEVGDSLMMFPKDSETFGAEAKEIVGCRCCIKYF